MIPAAPLSGLGLPLLHSLPGARAALFLDFDGFGSAFLPYDTDGKPYTFGPAERTVIEFAWRHVSSYFSMFDLDVTTEEPAPGSRYGYSIVSNSVQSVAFNYGSFPSTQPTNIHPPVDAAYRPSLMAHEIGHSFDLLHQGEFDNRGNLVEEYSDGYDALHGPIMGADYARDVRKWFIGHPSTSPMSLQDEVAAIAGRVRVYSGGDGFRPDDVPGSLADAVTLSADAQGRRAASGIIERLTDADAFSFESTGGAFQLDVTLPAPSMLDAKLEVYGPDGALVASSDAATNDQHLSLPWLAEGTYYAVVRSHGNYADLGPYDLSIRAIAGAPPEFAPGVPPAPAPPRLSAGEGTRVNVAWDTVEGATGYSVERSDDGAAWQQVGSVDASATAFDDGPPAGAHRYFYRVSTVGPGGRSFPSPAAHVVNRAAAPTGLTVTGWSGGVILNWGDTSGETGYRVYRRAEAPGAEPGPWALLAETGPNVPSITDLFLPAVRCRYRVVAVCPEGESGSSEALGGTPFDRVTGIRAAVPSGSREVRLGWDPIPFPAGYAIERGTNGTSFVRIANVMANDYVDATVDPAALYSYRVVGTDDIGFTGVSSVAAVVTPGTPLPPEWTVVDIGGAAAGAVGTTARDAVAYRAESGTFSVVGGGQGLLNPSGGFVQNDSFRFTYTTLAGDGSITARVVPGNTPAAGFAGLMFRDVSGQDSRYVAAGTSPLLGRGSFARPGTSGGFARADSGGATWVRIVRSVDTFTVYERSAAGWQVRRIFQVSMAESLQVGMFCSSGSDAALASATFEDVRVAAGAPPRVTAEATAWPPVVAGNYAGLFVEATDGRGETALVYSWSVEDQPEGVPPPILSVNDNNDAKYTSAVFAGTGRYVFRVTITNTVGLSVSSRVVVEVVQVLIGITIAPAGVAVRAGESLQFGATGVDQFGKPLVPAPPFRWYADYGQIEAGRYTAPQHAASVQVSVEANGLWASVPVLVYDESSPALLSAVSRKVHARRGAVDLPLALYGAPAVVEPRRGGPTTLLLTFSGNVVAADGSLGANDFNIVNASFRSARVDGNVVTLELQNVRDRGKVFVGAHSLTGAAGGGLIGDAAVEVYALHGDADRNGAVNAVDALALRSRAARRTGPQDLLYDLDLDGVVSVADQALSRRRITTSVLMQAASSVLSRVSPAVRSAYLGPVAQP